MKILIMCDLHIDINSIEIGRNLTSELIKAIKNKKPDLILIAGDLTNNAPDTTELLTRIEQEVGVKVLFVPGNHDIWTTRELAAVGMDSWGHYEHLAQHSSSLIDRPYHINEEYVVIGDMGWYDYSFAPPTISSYVMKSRKKQLWTNEAKHTHWGMDDQELMRLMLDKFQKAFEANKDKKVIFMNHFVPYQEFLTYSLNNDEYNVVNGFMGSSNLGWLIDQYPNIEYSIFGHIHKRHGIVNKTICNPLGYVEEWKTKDFAQELEDAMTIIEI